jgi:hypothetical protein
VVLAGFALIYAFDTIVPDSLADSPQWRFNNLAYVNPDDTGVGTHNGFVDYLIMGGIPFTAVYLALYLRIGARLWRAARRAAPPMTDVTALAFCLFLLCVADILRGDSFGKFSWCLLGVGLQTLSIHTTRRGEATSS